MPPGFVTIGGGVLVSDWVEAEEDDVLSTGGIGSLVV
jgi:hypothetical protein